ncbi:YoaK family protein [Laedolimicola intestinihominis]|uniref:YoaK family protein n=1 Tax=Laedolimicola intestinihominis TaxID=3133166 RepID=A0ABV1FJR0_9FIRM
MSLIHETEQEKQMSEAFVNSAFLALSGGFQDAYTYFTREEVFSNAQTGNVVLMSQHFMCGEWMAGLRYLFPILSFAVGVWVAEQIQGRYRYARKLHWRQSILLLEIVILFVVGFIPTRLDMMATALVSFSCAMQVQSFRKVNGYSYASTMCIGNLRSGIAALSGYVREHKSSQAEQMLYYFGIIFLFALGAGVGGVLSMNPAVSIRAIWVSCALLLVSFCLMFIEKPKIS